MRRHRLRASNEGWLTSYADLITNLLIFFILIISASQIQSGKLEKIVQAIASTGAAPESLTAAERQVQEALVAEGLQEDVGARLTDAGLEISFDSGVTFQPGFADIQPTMEEPLQRVLEVLRPFQERYRFAVEGHTDSQPVLGGPFADNWELSVARAMRVRQRLEVAGIDPQRLRVEAYADTKPLGDDQVAGVDEATRMAMHRRVVIRLH